MKLQLEFKSTKLWRSVSLAVLAAGLFGCADDAIPKNIGASGPEKPSLQVSVQWSPDNNAPYLLNGDRILRIHATEDQAFEVFARPKNGFDFFEESPITGDEYVAKGWQSGIESFGVLSLRNKVVLAMYTLDYTSADQLSEKVRQYQEAFSTIEPSVLPGDKASYWFWEVGRVRLMICASQDTKRKQQLVIALGDTDVMDALRMSPDSARLDLVEARLKAGERSP